MFIGVDFGSERLVAATHDNGSPQWSENSDAIYLCRQRAVIGAKGAVIHHPNQVALAVKSQLGAGSYDQMVDDRSWRPETLAALLLRSVVGDLGHTDLGEVTAAITVSASFDSVQRQSLRQAAEIAGLRNTIFVSDIAAAAAAWALERQPPDHRALICDLGAATCDLAIVRCEGRQLHVESVQGETWGSGGWDALVLEEIAHTIESEVGKSPLDPLTEKRWRRALTPLAARIRCRLDHRHMASWETRFDEQLVRGWLYVHQLEQLVTPTLDWLEGQIQHLLGDQSVDALLLTGGGSRMPLARQRIERACRRAAEDRSGLHLTAVGAAHLARQHADGALPDDVAVQITDVAPASIGVQTVDRRSKRAINKIVLEANAPLPCYRILKLGQAGDTQINVKLLQGELEAAEDNRFLGECRLTSAICGSEPIQLRVGYDRNGELAVSLQLANGLVKVPVVRDETLTPDECSELARRLQRLECSSVV